MPQITNANDPDLVNWLPFIIDNVTFTEETVRGCDDIQGRRMMDMTNGIQIIIKGEGYMGSNTFNQPYKEFPLLRRLIV